MGERIKDLIYDFSDIIISLVIITMIFGVVSWKISDSMAYTQFTGQPTKAVLDKNDTASGSSEATDPTTTTGGETGSDTQGNSTGVADTSGTTTTPTNTTGTTTTDTSSQGGKPSASAGTTAPTTPTTTPSSGVSADVKIVIPAGSAGITIAKILKAQGIITDTKTFITRVDELKMGPKLKAGTFTIKAGSTMDQVIYTIAGKK